MFVYYEGLYKLYKGLEDKKFSCWLILFYKITNDNWINEITLVFEKSTNNNLIIFFYIILTTILL